MLCINYINYRLSYNEIQENSSRMIQRDYKAKKVQNNARYANISLLTTVDYYTQN